MYLFGASGHAKVIIDILKSQGGTVKGFFDDDVTRLELGGVPVIGITEDHSAVHNPCLIAIGNNRIRKNVVGRLPQAVYQKAIHTSAIVAESVHVGEGTAVMAGTVINPDTSIGEHCIINTSASVDHDCEVGDFVHIAPNVTLCGGIKVGEGTFIGAGAPVIPNISIGKWVTIGAGAVVIADVPDYAVVVGNPGQIIKYNTP